MWAQTLIVLPAVTFQCDGYSFVAGGALIIAYTLSRIAMIPSALHYVLFRVAHRTRYNIISPHQIIQYVC